jgi:uncharacterized lipoprotein YddW (UPF0748 family)
VVLAFGGEQTGRVRRVGLVAAVTVTLMAVVAASAPGPPRPDAGASGGTAASAPPRARAATCGGRPLVAPRQLRGMWIATVNNIDWPSRPGLDAEAVRAEYRSWLDLAQRLQHNAVFVHIRPSGDAFWPTPYAPWSEWLTGRRDGVGPGWDPLAFLVAETHARNIEFHAWFNPYRGSQPAPAGAGADLNQLAPDHPLRAHPEWAVAYPAGAAGRLYYDPGIPEARRFVEDSIMDAVARYDIDAVHFDDFFYPYPVAGQDFGDDASFARYGAGFASKADWRRDNVNQLVRETGQRIRALKPWVKFGISPFGIWRNSSTDPAGSATRGLQSYDAIYADTRLWVSREWLDYIVPQVYWHIGFDVADYARLVPWWSNVVAGTRVQLYIGQADYRVGQAGAWQDPAELDRQLTFNERYPVSGNVHFSAKNVRADPLGAVTRYSVGHYGAPALVPQMARPHEAATAPLTAPTVRAAHREADGTVTLRWSPGTGRPPTSYAVYRVDGPVARLAGTTRDRSWVDRTPPAGRGDAYCVAALDRLWNAGPPAWRAPRLDAAAKPTYGLDHLPSIDSDRWTDRSQHQSGTRLFRPRGDGRLMCRAGTNFVARESPTVEQCLPSSGGGFGRARTARR